MGDIKEMYHQILVSPKGRNALRFVRHKFSTVPMKIIKILKIIK